MTGFFPWDLQGSSGAVGHAIKLQWRKNLSCGQCWSKLCLKCPNPPCV